MADEDREKRKPTYEGAPFYGSGGSGDEGNGDRGHGGRGDGGGRDEGNGDEGDGRHVSPAPRVNGKSYSGDGPAGSGDRQGYQGYQEQYNGSQFGYNQFNGYGGRPYQAVSGSGHIDVLGRPIAPWWRRAVAYIIDIILINIVGSVLTSLLFPGNLKTGKNGLPVFDAHLFTIYVFWIVVLLGYFALLDGSNRGQTIGKMALGIATRDANTGGQLGAARALLRRFVFIALFSIFIIPGVINALSPLWSRSWSAWHDYAGKSQVISIR